MFSHSQTPTGGVAISHWREAAARVPVSHRATDLQFCFWVLFFFLVDEQFGAAGLELPGCNPTPLWAGRQVKLPDNRIILRHFAADESLLIFPRPRRGGRRPAGGEPGLKGPSR